MKAANKLLAIIAVLPVLYFALYFSNVTTGTLYGLEYEVHFPMYRLDSPNGDFRVLFAPAHWIDAKLLRRSHWAEKVGP